MKFTFLLKKKGPGNTWYLKSSYRHTLGLIITCILIIVILIYISTQITRTENNKYFQNYLFFHQLTWYQHSEWKVPISENLCFASQPSFLIWSLSFRINLIQIAIIIWGCQETGLPFGKTAVKIRRKAETASLSSLKMNIHGDCILLSCKILFFCAVE